MIISTAQCKQARANPGIAGYINHVKHDLKHGRERVLGNYTYSYYIYCIIGRICDHLQLDLVRSDRTILAKNLAASLGVAYKETENNVHS